MADVTCQSRSCFMGHGDFTVLCDGIVRRAHRARDPGTALVGHHFEAALPAFESGGHLRSLEGDCSAHSAANWAMVSSMIGRNVALQRNDWPSAVCVRNCTLWPTLTENRKVQSSPFGAEQNHHGILVSRNPLHRERVAFAATNGHCLSGRDRKRFVGIARPPAASLPAEVRRGPRFSYRGTVERA